MRKRQREKLLYIILLVNLAGTLFGFYYYLEQLQASPIYLWIFIPASPLATLFFATSIYLNSQERGRGLLDALAFFGNLKYGLWTVFVLTYYSEIFFTGNALPLYFFMLFSHLGMALQAFIVFYWQKMSYKHLGLAFAWFLLNDLIDYTMGTHTELYTQNVFPAEIAAYLLTLTGFLIGYIMIEKAPSIIARYGPGKIQ
mgnify:CR=1 FL=1